MNDINLENSGSLHGVTVGGTGNIASYRQGESSAEELAAELRLVERQLANFPVSEEGAGDREVVRQAREAAERGDHHRAVALLSTVGSWVAMVAASVSAMIVKDHIGG